MNNINLEKAKRAIKGEIFIHRAVGTVKYNKDMWNQFLEDKTFQIYVHSLSMITYLSEVYADTRETKYIDLASEIIHNWLEVEHQSIHVWHEQPVASRLKNFVYYQSVVESSHKINYDLYEKLLNEHVNYLIDDTNYKENNHGVIMDKNLAAILPYLDENKAILKNNIAQIVILRTRNVLNRDFSYKGLHLENSPDYHRLVLKWIEDIEQNLNSVDKTIGEKYMQKVKDYKSVESLVIKPNKRYPIIGDSSRGTYNGHKSFENLIDYESGRIILHNKNYNSQLTFISGYGTRGHKHFDDLSFTFYDGETDLFDDSGKYNYNAKDPIREHVKSPLGHNSLSLYKKNYKLANKQKIRNLVGISSYNEYKNFHVITGYNKAYDNLQLKRTLIFTKSNSIILIDSFFSEAQHTIAQNFNLGEKIKAERLDNSTFTLKSLNNTYLLKTHNLPFTAVLLNNSKNTPCVISNTFNELIENQRVLIRKKSKSGRFITSITNQNDYIEDLKIIDDFLYFTLNKETFIVNLSL